MSDPSDPSATIGDTSVADTAERVDTAEAFEPAAHPPAPPPELKRGDSIGRFVVLERLGGGGMGVVYLACARGAGWASARA